MSKLQKAKDVIYHLAGLYILWRGFVRLDEAASQSNVYKMIVGFTYLAVGVFAIWMNTKIAEDPNR